jgi:hypothetical protein
VRPRDVWPFGVKPRGVKPRAWPRAVRPRGVKRRRGEAPCCEAPWYEEEER